MIHYKVRLGFFVALYMVMGIICTGPVYGDQAKKDFITVDPVNTTPVGELLIVSGTTDLPGGTELLIMISGGGSNTGTKVINGTGGMNRWSVPIDTSTIKPGKYTINLKDIKELNVEKMEYIYGNTTASAPVTLTGTFLGSDTTVSGKNQKNAFITLEPIPDKKTGDLFLVTGKTNLSVGTDVMWQVNPTILDREKDNLTGIQSLTGVMANSMVTKGTGQNQVTLAVNTYYLNPDEYNISVATIEGDIFAQNMTYGPVSDSEVFTLR